MKKETNTCRKKIKVLLMLLWARKRKDCLEKASLMSKSEWSRDTAKE